MVGQTVGKYRIVDRVGRGGMGTVYRAIDETLHREVAIKALNAELNDPGVGRRFRAEAVAIARLNHPGIATIFELVQHEGQWLMVMEFVRGETLENLVARSGALPPDQAAELCMQVLSALAHAHSMGVVHRDLKPANILCTAAGATKITDFGIARVAGTEHLTSVGFLMGTPAYMAPEQVLGREIDARTDLYSLGVVLYFLVTAKLPFKGDTAMAMAQSRIKDLPTPIRAIRQELPAWLSQVTDRALTRAIDRRFQTADEFREALRRGVAGLPMEPTFSAQLPAELIATMMPAALNAPPVHSWTGPTPAPVAGPTPAALASFPSLTPASMPTTAPEVGPDAPTVLAAPPPPPARPRLSRTGAATVAGVALLILGGGFLWVASRSRDTSMTTPPAPAASPGSTPADRSGAPGTDAAAGGAPPSGGPADAGRGGAVGAPINPARSSVGSDAGTVAETALSNLPSVPGSPVVGRSAGSVVPPASVGRAEGRTGRGVNADTVLRYDTIKQLVVSGRNGSERDALLYFGGGLISLVGRNGEALATFQYRDLGAATYARAKDPKWDETLAAPPSNLDVPGGIFRSSRHWLVLQSKTSYAVLRLEDGSWKGVVETLEARTGIKVVQPR